MQPVASQPVCRRHGQMPEPFLLEEHSCHTSTKSNPTTGPVSRLFLPQRVVIFGLAGLLVFYHTYTLFELYAGSGTDLYGGPGANGHPLYMHTQSILRLLIIVSLILVAMNRRSALYGMWAAIGAL